MQKYCFVFFLLLILSCDLPSESKQKERTDDMAKEADFLKVDTYPKFPNCKETLKMDKEQDCFLKELNSFMNNALKQRSALLRSVDENDLELYISIDRKGKMQVDSLSISESSRDNMDQLINDLNNKLLRKLRAEEDAWEVVTFDDEAKAWKTVWSAGQGVSQIHDVLSVPDLVSRLTEEYRSARERLLSTGS